MNEVAITVECDGRKHTIRVANVEDARETLRNLASGAVDGLLSDAIEYVLTGEWPAIP